MNSCTAWKLNLLVIIAAILLLGCGEEKTWTHDCSLVATYDESEWTYEERSHNKFFFESIRWVEFGEIRRPNDYEFKNKGPRIRTGVLGGAHGYSIDDINRVLKFLNLQPVTHLYIISRSGYVTKYSEGFLHISIHDWDRHPMTGAQMSQYEKGCSSVMQIHIEQFVKKWSE